MKKFFEEFKKFIMRGNVIDMAVGVIVGSAFTAIVTALTNKIFMPLINYLLLLITGGSDGFADAVTFLKKVTDAEGVIDMTKSIYIDWGAFITAIINFILIAFVLFCIVKAINSVKEAGDGYYMGFTRKEYQELRAKGLKRKQISALAKERAKAAAEEKARKEAEEKEKAAQPTKTEQLLTEILEELKNQK